MKNTKSLPLHIQARIDAAKAHWLLARQTEKKRNDGLIHCRDDEAILKRIEQEIILNYKLGVYGQ